MSEFDESKHPRVQRGHDNSGEFTRKGGATDEFENWTEHDLNPPSEAIRSAVFGASTREFFERYKGSKTESLRILGRDGSAIGSDIAGEAHTVKIPPDTVRSAKDNILIHNHPGKLAFSLSPADFAAARSMDVAAMAAVTASGEVSIVYRPNKGWGTVDANVMNRALAINPKFMESDTPVKRLRAAYDIEFGEVTFRLLSSKSAESRAAYKAATSALAGELRLSYEVRKIK